MALSVSFIETTAASLGLLVTMFAVPTIESYWLVTHLFEAIFGCEVRWAATAFKSVGSITSSILNFLNS